MRHTLLCRRIGISLSAACLLFGGQAWGKAPSAKNPEVHRKAEDQVSTDRETTSLKDLVRELQERNPALQAAQKAAEAKKASIISARTLPDPVLSFQTMGDFFPPDLQGGDPSSGRTLGVEQEIPFPGKLGLKGKIAESEAAAEEWNTEQTRRELIADLKAAYFDLALTDKSIEILEKDRGLLQSITQVAEARYRVGEGNQQDVIKAQLEISKLLDRQAVLEQRRVIAEALLNSLLLRPSEAKVGKTAEVKKAELPYSLEELNQMARENSAKLKTQEKTIDRSQYAVELARKEYYPDFAVGFSYVDRDDMKEMYGIMAKAKLPLYFWRKQRPDLESARLTLTSAQKQRESITSTLNYSVRDAQVVATTSERLIHLYGNAIIPQSKIALESAFAAYQTGSVDFLTLLDSLVTLLDYELKYFEALTEFQKALAKLEPIIGVELIH
jgi:outer membrane protein TolC